jgi:hypothetical protein
MLEKRKASLIIARKAKEYRKSKAIESAAKSKVMMGAVKNW